MNNTLVNLLHVQTASGADAMQTVRITIAQTLSTVTVLAAFVVWRRKEKKKRCLL